jgi:rfaE bifunctional protein kinase chain/domain
MQNVNNDAYRSRSEPLSRETLDSILSDISKLKIGVIGDACVDIYWHADMTKSELSRETPHHPLPIVKELFSPGAAGNVAINLKALGCQEVSVCSVIGSDWRGNMLSDLFDKAGIKDTYMLVEDNWITPAYCKPIRWGLQNAKQEDARIDFVNMTSLTDRQMEKLLEKIDQMMDSSDAVVVNDQFKCGIIAPEVRKRLTEWARRGKLIVVDSRDRIGLFEELIVKPNEVESLRWHRPDDNLPASTWDDWLEAGKRLSEKNCAPCCMTLGEHGAIWFDHGEYIHVPTTPVDAPIDIVGAGDCFAASLLCVLAMGLQGPTAIGFAHLSTAVVLKKMGMTGTASPEEILYRYEAICRKT